MLCCISTMMQTTTRLKLTALNEHLLCVLCGGYLVDATTITECLHSFCKSCIVRYMEAHKTCPRCDVLVHKTKPLLNLRPDRTLQTLVYKLVPGLFQSEKRKRREFYASRPEAVPTSGADSGDIEESYLMYTEDEKISLCLQHSNRLPALKFNNQARRADDKEKDKRYLLCPALVTIACLKKFIQLKFDLPAHLQVEIFHSDVTLKDACTLMDVANIYSWKRAKPMTLQYIVFDKTQLSLELPDPTEAPIDTTEQTVKKRKRKRNTSGKSPNGLVKSRVFKPPKPRVRKPSKPSGSGGKKKSPGANEDDNKQGTESASDDCVVISTQLGPCAKDHSITPITEVSSLVGSDKEEPVTEESDSAETRTTPVTVSSVDTPATVHDTSGERFEVVMDTVSEENAISAVPQPSSQSEGDAAESNPKQDSKQEPPHTIVKIRMNSCNSEGKVGPEVVLKGKNKRSPKSRDKSRLSTKKTKSPKQAKGDKCTVDGGVLGNGKDGDCIMESPKCNSKDTMNTSGDTLRDNHVHSPQGDSKQSNTEKRGIVKPKVHDGEDKNPVSEYNGEKSPVIDSTTVAHNSGDSMDISPVSSPAVSIVTTLSQSTPTTNTTDMDISPALSPPNPSASVPPQSPPQAITKDKADCQDNTTNVKDSSMEVEDSVGCEVNERERKSRNNLVNQPDLVISTVTSSECQSKTSTITKSPAWSDKYETNEDSARKLVEKGVERIEQQGAISPLASGTPEPAIDSLLPGMSSHEVAKQRSSPASSICSAASSAPGHSDITIEESLSSPGSQTSSAECPGQSHTPRNRKLSASNRDKAKSINSIIKKIEERKSKKNEIGKAIPGLPVTPPMTSLPVTSRVTPSEYTATSPSLGYSSPSPTAEGRMPHMKNTTKRRAVSDTRTSPDATPIKRLKQLCNVFGDDKPTEPVAKQRFKPPSTGPNINHQQQTSQQQQQQQAMFNQYNQFKRTPMDPRAIMQSLQMHHLNQIRSQQLAQQQHNIAQQQHTARNNSVGLNKRPSPASTRVRPDGAGPSVKPSYGGNKRLDHIPHPASRPMDSMPHPPGRQVDSIPRPAGRPVDSVSPSNKPRPGTNMRPAHTATNPYYPPGYNNNPLANGYDEPLELTTKKSRDRKAEEQHQPRPQGTFLKIPNLMKP